MFISTVLTIITIILNLTYPTKLWVYQLVHYLDPHCMGLGTIHKWRHAGKGEGVSDFVTLYMKV